MSDSAQVQALVARAVSEFGALDVTFNNAGLLPPTAPLAEQTEDDWHRIMRVDVTGVFLCLKHELAQMAKAGYDVIVNTASVAGLRGSPTVPLPGHCVCNFACGKGCISHRR